MKNGFTDTEKKILAVFSDKDMHTRKELLACLPDPLSGRKALNTHLSRIRKKLPDDEMILSRVFNKTIYFQHVRKL
jgi:hypothetical protein